MTSGDAGAGQRELIDALVRSSFEVMAVLSRIGAEYDLSLTQLRVLGDPAGPADQDERARRPSRAGQVDGLRPGRPGREAGPGATGADQADGRAVVVFLTAAGTELAWRGAAQVAQALAPKTGPLTRAQARQLTALLGHFLDGSGP